MEEQSQRSRLSKLYVKLIIAVVIISTFFTGVCGFLFSMFTRTALASLFEKFGVGETVLGHWTTQFSDQANFNSTRVILLLVFVLGLMISITLMKQINRLNSNVGKLIVVIKKGFKQLFFRSKEFNSYVNNIALYSYLLVIAVLSYGVVVYPLSVDELSSFLFFVNKGPHVVTLYYPSPNNHVFFNLIASIVGLLSDSAVIVMKGTAFVVTAAVLRIVQLVLLRWFSLKNAIIGFLFFALNFNIAYYSVHGRGYVLLIGFTMLFLFSIWKLIVKGERDFVGFAVIVGSLGLYTIPVFVYPMGAVLIWGVCCQTSSRLNSLRVLSFIGVMACWWAGILYVPILFFNGLNSLIGNHWVQALSWQYVSSNMWSYFLELNNWFWDLNSFGFILSMILMAFVLMLYFRKRAIMISVAIVIIFPIMVVLLQHVLPIHRAWIPWLIAFSMAFAAVFQKVNPPKYVYMVAAFLLFANYGRGIYRVKGEGHLSIYEHTNAMVQKIDFSNGEVFAEDDTYAIYCRYDFHVRDLKYPTIVLGEYDSSKAYQTLILNQPIPSKLDGYDQIYSDDLVRVFERTIPWKAD